MTREPYVAGRPRTGQRLTAGRVFADGQTHGFVGTPPTAICAAGLLLARTGGWFDPDDDQACFTCAHLTSSHAGSAASA